MSKGFFKTNEMIMCLREWEKVMVDGWVTQKKAELQKAELHPLEYSGTYLSGIVPRYPSTPVPAWFTSASQQSNDGCCEGGLFTPEYQRSLLVIDRPSQDLTAMSFTIRKQNRVFLTLPSSISMHFQISLSSRKENPVFSRGNRLRFSPR